MKVVATAAVATATVASNLGYAQPAPPPEASAPLAGSLRYAQPEDVSHMHHSELQSNLSYAQQASSPTVRFVSPQAGEEVNQMTSRPKTPVEFARNLKIIFDNDLLLQDDFYTEASLKDVFNLEEVRISSSDNGENRHISIAASVPDSIFSRIKTSDFFGGSASGAQLVGGKTIHRSGLVTAGINFGMDEGGPGFDETRSIFDGDFAYLPPEPSPHGGPPPATAPHGNETWRYRKVGDQAEKTITIGFNPAGALSRIVIDIKKN